MEIAADVRTELEDIAERMLYHFLIVLVEDFPDPYDNHTWEGQVMMAGSTLFGYIMSGIWFTLPIELSLCIDESTNKVGMVIVCPDELLEEFEIVLENNSDLEVAPEPEGDWWYAPLMGMDILHIQLSRQTDNLIKTGKSYLKQDRFRYHRNLVMKYMKQEEPDENSGSPAE